MRRAIFSVLATSAIALSSLAATTFPANAVTIGSPAIDPSTWSAGATSAATVTWTESASTSTNAAFNDSNPSAGGNFVSIEVGWGWTLANANPTATPVTYAATWDGTATFTCATIGVSFSSPGFSSAGTGPQCLVRRSSTYSGNPGQQVVLASKDGTNYFGFSGTGSPTITVAFASGKVTAPNALGSSDTWRIISLTQANTLTVTTTVPAADSAGNPVPIVTINFDGNGGQCSTNQVTGYQTTWTTAPAEGDCTRSGFTFAGYNTAADGSGTAVAAGGNLNLTGDNTLYAQWVQPRVASAPTDVVATSGFKNMKVSWKAPADTGTSPIAAYLVQANPGGSTCITNMASANMLECTYTRLEPGTKYTFKVQALNRAGWGAFSADSNTASPYNVLLDTLSRPEVKTLFIKRGSTLEAEGRAPGLDAGAILTPVLQIGADGTFVPLTRETTKVKGDGAFTWSRKLDKRDNGKPVSLYFTYGDAKTETLTARLGATIGLPSAPRNVSVKSTTTGITVSWQPPARDGGSPVTEYVVTSDLRAPSGARARFVTCTVEAPATSCTRDASLVAFSESNTYSFSVVAKTERGTSPQGSAKWKGELYNLNIFRTSRQDSEVQLSFRAAGWSNRSQSFEVQAKVGENGAWRKQGTARLNPDYVGSYGDWDGMLPKSSTAGSTVFYRLKSDKGFSNEVRFRLSSSFVYNSN